MSSLVANNEKTSLEAHLVSEAVQGFQEETTITEGAVLKKLVEAYGDRPLAEFTKLVDGLHQLPSEKPLADEGSRTLVKDFIEHGLIGTVNRNHKAKVGPGTIRLQDMSGGKKLASDREKSGPEKMDLATKAETGGVELQSKGGRRRVARRGAVKVELVRSRKHDAKEDESGPRIGRADAAKGGIKEPSKSEKPDQPNPIATLDETRLQRIKAEDLVISPVDVQVLPVPGLSHDLSRVLFNPGVYQLQDPRSRVYNFDPYLQNIMPVTEFDFDALKDYITSSKDDTLSSIATKRGRKFVGSSSSMTGILAHFHFLLSQWRNINTATLSRGFPESLKSFTAIQRAPSAVFLRYKDGIYAVDADKEYDSSNILMSLGRSMEKLLTLSKDDFERYRKSNQTEFSEQERLEPESYHYSEMGDFLMRSQLDAYDPRLPGTGMFDLKTRAVVSIRMNTRDHERGLGYEIKDRFGGWESYERETFDMIRSAFLKYSLQVRMGRMDGIFVAFHNIERIFGFQYVSLPELDLHLHGQSDVALGDQEFKLSIGLLNDVFERATQKFPGRSLRFHFETRNTQTPFMYIYAEPVNDEDITAIQESKKDEIAKFNEKIFGMVETQSDTAETEAPTSSEPKTAAEALVSSESLHLDSEDAESSAAPASEVSIRSDEVIVSDDPAASEETAISASSDESATSESSIDADVSFLDSIGKTLEESIQNPSKSKKSSLPPVDSSGPLMAMVLTIRNNVNGKAISRPEKLDPSDKWTVEYNLKEEERPEVAWRLYNACKARRKVGLAFSEQSDEDIAANYYLKKIHDFTKKGAKWRKEQDKMDKKREPVVLYGDKSQ